MDKKYIAIDAMGGDKAPDVVIDGIIDFNSRYPSSNWNFAVFGCQNKVLPLLEKKPIHNVVFNHCDEYITPDTKPSIAIRMGKKSSMALAIDHVLQKKSQAVVSAGNTGAFMALSKIILKTFDGIDRPAIPALIPSHSKQKCTLVLDLGANIECSAENLVQFAVMGSAYMEKLTNVANPSVGILNVGNEELKGNQIVQAAAHFLKDHPLVNFYGFVEGDDITKGTVDVVVTDGFTGNIVLKAIEGTVRLFANELKQRLNTNIVTKMGALMAKNSLTSFKNLIDPRLYNGAMFLGLKGISIKSHGGTDAFGFANALKVAIEMAQKNLITDLQIGLEGIQ